MFLRQTFENSAGHKAGEQIGLHQVYDPDNAHGFVDVAPKGERVGGISAGDAHPAGKYAEGHFFVFEDDFDIRLSGCRGFLDGAAQNHKRQAGGAWLRGYGEANGMPLRQGAELLANPAVGMGEYANTAIEHLEHHTAGQGTGTMHG